MFAPRTSRPSDFRNQACHKHKKTRDEKKSPLADLAVGVGKTREEKKSPLADSAVGVGKTKDEKTSPLADLAVRFGTQNETESITASFEPTILETATLAEAFLSCGNKDYFLVVGKSNKLVGIITSTDIVHRAVVYGRNPRLTIVSQIMTRNPVVHDDSIESNHALMLMISHKIKHLPICNQQGYTVCVLHLGDVFNEYLEKACQKLDTAENLHKAILSAKNTLGTNESLAHMLASAGELVHKSSLPNFSALMANQGPPIFVGSQFSVRLAAQIMKDKSASSVCLMDKFGPVSQKQGRISQRILGLCSLRDVAFHFLKFGTVALKSRVTSIMKNRPILRVQPSTNSYEMARKMLKYRYPDTLVETMDGIFSIVNILSISTALVCQENQHSRSGKHMDMTLPNGLAQCPTTIGQALHSTNNHDIPWIYEAPPEYTFQITSDMPSASANPVETIPNSSSYPLQGPQALIDLKKHYDVFHDYLPIKDRSGANLDQSTAQLKIISLNSVQLFELSTDVYDELLRRQNAWYEEWIIPFLRRRVDFNSIRNQDREKLSLVSYSHFQDLVEGVYIELYQRYPALRETSYFSKTDAIIKLVIARLTAIFENVSQYRGLLGFRMWKAQQLLDFFQFALDIPGLLPKLQRSLIVATQRLSQVSNLFPTCYELKGIKLIGDHPVASGGFADIYKGHCYGQIVCLKVIRVYQNSHLQSILKRVSAEATLWGQLRHPNILPFYGLYRFNNRLCLVSPWLDLDIKQFLSDNPDVNRRLLVSDVASGMAFLHSLDIVHGDLKADNILIDASQRATIADFGLSSVSDSDILCWPSHSTPASKGGSVRWQAPELFDDVKDEVVHNTKASDIYAFSCVAYEIYTEKLPFFELGKLEATIMFQVKAGARPSCPTDLSPAWWPMRLTRSFWTMMESCWNPKPEERPSINVIAAHGDLRRLDTRRVADDISLSKFRHRPNPPSSGILQKILMDLESLKDGTSV